MKFYKETIMGQVLHQVHIEENNKECLNKLDELMDRIDDEEYFENENIVWDQYGLVVSNKPDNHLNKMIVETENINEYSWFLEEIFDIYQPNKKDIYRFVSTLGFLLNLYTKKYDDLSVIFRNTVVSSTVFLHPSHLGMDRFAIQPINLPKFGREF